MKTYLSSFIRYTGVLLCSMLLLFSCSKDDGPENRSPSIVGKWSYVSISGQPPLSDCAKQSSMLFTTEQLQTVVYIDDDISGDCKVLRSFEVDYEVDGNQLKMIDDDGTTASKIINHRYRACVIRTRSDT